jgi:hypothetical protein
MSIVRQALFFAVLMFSGNVFSLDEIIKLKISDEFLGEEKLRGSPETYVFLKGGELAYYSRGWVDGSYSDLEETLRNNKITYVAKSDARMKFEADHQISFMTDELKKGMRGLPKADVEAKIEEYQFYWRKGFMKKPLPYKTLIQQLQFGDLSERVSLENLNDEDMVFVTYYTDWCEPCKKQKKKVSTFIKTNANSKDKIHWLYVERD